MDTGWRPAPTIPPIRQPAVAGTFYPAEPDRLADLVGGLLAEAGRRTAEAVGDLGARERQPAFGRQPTDRPLLGILVPHAGLVYSGVIAAAGWRLLAAGNDGPRSAARLGAPPTTVVLLGTNHAAAWLDGVGAWEAGAWRTPLGDLGVDADLARAILALGDPFVIDRAAHTGEHSIEVQLPILRAVMPQTRIVPLAVATGTGPDAIAAGGRLGALLAARRARGERIGLAISSDMAHYPPAIACARTTSELLPSMLALDATALAHAEGALRRAGIPGLACGMCGIEPAVLGLAALRAMGAARGLPLAAATSADAGGPPDRTVGYLAVGFPG
jgi:AmmeMemoRadiSam system protein B